MNGYRYLIKNIGLLTIANFTTKILQFFLVPLYTSILSTADYGTFDLFNTTINLLVPILTLNIQEAVVRFSLDKNVKKSTVLTIGIKYIVISNTIVLIGLIINCIFNFWTLGEEYAPFFFLMFLAQSLSGVVTNYVRGIDRIKDLSVSSVIATIVTILLNVLLLVTFQMGLVGYFVANIVGPIVQCIYLSIRCNLKKYIHLEALRKSKEQKEMIQYSTPMIANAVAWWVNNASDRYVVIFFCGLAANGIYSVASKIPAILNMFQLIFNQAWILSAVKDFDSEDNSGFFANIYRAYNCLMTILCSLIIVGDKILARILYAKDFYIAWRYVPWLTISIVFGALSGYLGGFFSAAKDSKIFATSTAIGAISNIILNIIFTPLIGPLGAAIATAICYVIVFIIRYIQSKKYIILKINLIRDVVSYILLVVQSVVLLFVNENILLYSVLSGIFLLIILLYIKDIKLVINKIVRRKNYGSKNIIKKGEREGH